MRFNHFRHPELADHFDKDILDVGKKARLGLSDLLSLQISQTLRKLMNKPQPKYPPRQPWQGNSSYPR